MSGWWAAPAKRRWRRNRRRRGGKVRDLTGTDLPQRILAMAAAGVAIPNDLRVDAYRGGDRHADDGIFGPDDPPISGRR